MGKKKPASVRRALVSCVSRNYCNILVAQRNVFLDDLWCDENQKFRFVIGSIVTLEQLADQRQVTEERYQRYTLDLGLFIDATEYNRLAIVDQHLRADFTSIDTWYAAEDLTYLSLIHI